MTHLGDRLYKCEICGKEGPWDDNWSWYGSILHLEECPDELPTACSAKCYYKIDAKIKSGEFVIPELRRRGYCHDIVKERRGY